jgi:hypothetical protein
MFSALYFFAHLGHIYDEVEGGVGPIVLPPCYITEDASQPYILEDASDVYVPEFTMLVAENGTTGYVAENGTTFYIEG